MLISAERVYGKMLQATVPAGSANRQPSCGILSTSDRLHAHNSGGIAGRVGQAPFRRRGNVRRCERREGCATLLLSACFDFISFLVNLVRASSSLCCYCTYPTPSYKLALTALPWSKASPAYSVLGPDDCDRMTCCGIAYMQQWDRDQSRCQDPTAIQGWVVSTRQHRGALKQ